MSRGIRIAAIAAVVCALAVAMPTGHAQQGSGKVSIWAGVYTAEQSKRGEAFYPGACAQCHGPRLNGATQPDQPPSPAIARVGFLKKWAGKSVAELFEVVRERMPSDNPGTLTDQQAADVIAHMFAVSNIPTGSKELPASMKSLEAFVIEAEGK